MENRTAARVRSFLRGEIIHSNGASRTECTIRDLSETGARVEAPSSVTLPEFFELWIPIRAVQRRVQIVWRHGSELGIRFIAEQQAAPPKPRADVASNDEAAAVIPDDQVSARLLQLEAETAALREQLAEMKLALREVLNDRRTA
jgi:hypothetical protein